MRINVVAIVLSLFIFKITVAQPWHSSSPFGSTGCNVVEILKQGSIVAGGGRLSPDSLQVMFSSRDYGQTWTENQNDGLFSWNKSIAFADSVNGIGVGDNGRIIRTVNGGLTWNNSASPIARNFNKIINVSPLIYYAVGGLKDSVQTIIKTNDGGQSWSVVRDTTGAMLNSVFFLNVAIGYAVGDSGMILTTNNGGSLWSQATTNLQRDFNAIKFINADTGYIAGGLDAANQTRTILKTVNAGLQWNVIVDQAGSEIREISFSDGRNGFMVGDSAAFLISTDGGNSWIQELVPGASSDERFNSVRFLSADFGVVGSASGTVYVYTHHLFPVPLIQNEVAVFKSGSLSLAAGINTSGNPDNVSFYVAADSLLTAPSMVGPIPFNSTGFAPAIADVSYLLATPGTYYFSCVVNTLDSTYSGDTISFIVPSHLPEVTTLSSTNISIHSLTLNGAVRDLPGPSNIYFEYLSSFDSSTITVAALPAVVNDTQAYTVLANIAGLIPYLNYDVRVKAVHGNLVMYGNYIAFSSTGQTVIADNRPAANVTSTSATLWAQVGYLPFRSQVEFEYSLAGSSSIDTIAATPFLITDQGVYNVSANIGNLLPGNLYRYRVKILDSTQVIYGGMDTYFFTGSMQSVAVDSASNVTLTSADLYGHVNDIHFNADVYFTYWAQGISTQSAVGTPGSIYDTLNHVVSASVSGLMPYTTYSYSINANDPPYLLQSTPGTFYTGPLNQTPLILTVDPASNVDSNSATLSGTVNHLASAGQVYFEYWERGTNPILVSALPSNINDTLMHRVAVSITGLNPSSLYLYRIKISGSLGTVYSDSVSFFYGVNTIPNFDFENWTIVTGEYPTNWINIFGPAQKVSPGADGSNYAVRLQGGIAGLLNALPAIGGNGPVVFASGFPYAARPDTLTGMFNYNVVSGDTALVLVEFKNAQQVLSQQFFPITGNSNGVFQKLKFPITYNSGIMPDTVVLGFCPKNIFVDVPLRGSSLTVDNVTFGPGFPAIPNGGFENWTTFTYRQLDNWAYMDMENFGAFDAPDSGCVRQTSDAWHGNFAAELHNVVLPSAGQKVNAYLSTNPFVVNGGEGPSFVLNHQPATLTGSYKFSPQDGDSLNIVCRFFKNGIQTGTAEFHSTQPALNFTQFSVPCRYDVGQGADSANIKISILPSSPSGLSSAVVDYLVFDATQNISTSVKQTRTSNLAATIYPNPANNLVTIKCAGLTDDKNELRICDLYGKVLYRNGFESIDGHLIKEIDVSKFAPGIYFITVQAGADVYLSKLIIER